MFCKQAANINDWNSLVLKSTFNNGLKTILENVQEMFFQVFILFYFFQKENTQQ